MKEFLKALIPYFIICSILMFIGNYDKVFNYKAISQLENELDKHENDIKSKYNSENIQKFFLKNSDDLTLKEIKNYFLYSTNYLFIEGTIFEISKNINNPFIEMSCEINDNTSMIAKFSINSLALSDIKNYADKNYELNTNFIDNLIYFIGLKIFMVCSVDHIDELLSSDKVDHTLIIAKGKCSGFIIYNQKIDDYDNISNGCVLSLMLFYLLFNYYFIIFTSIN